MYGLESVYKTRMFIPGIESSLGIFQRFLPVPVPGARLGIGGAFPRQKWLSDIGRSLGVVMTWFLHLANEQAESESVAAKGPFAGLR